jgi:predicted transcriptional regulator
MAKKPNEVGVSFSLDREIKEKLVEIGEEKDLNFSQILRRAAALYVQIHGNKGDNEDMKE